MPAIKFYLIDDEPDALLNMTMVLHSMSEEFEIKVQSDFTKTYSEILDFLPDIIICDVLIDGKPRGLELGKYLLKQTTATWKFLFVFISQNPDFAGDAYILAGIDLLHKPLTPKGVNDLINQYKSQMLSLTTEDYRNSIYESMLLLESNQEKSEVGNMEFRFSKNLGGPKTTFKYKVGEVMLLKSEKISGKSYASIVFVNERKPSVVYTKSLEYTQRDIVTKIIENYDYKNGLFIRLGNHIYFNLLYYIDYEKSKNVVTYKIGGKTIKRNLADFG